MTRLSVNVNKLATLRNSRGKNRPDVLHFAKKILEFGVAGITVHPRPDGRHIRKGDVEELHALLRRWNDDVRAKVEFNIEGFPSADYIELLHSFTPDQATLVPDPPDALTSNAGWDLERNQEFLINVVTDLRKIGSRVSLFVDPFQFTSAQAKALAEIRPDRIELYTERYADAFDTEERENITAAYRKLAEAARNIGIGVNAGHDLSQDNLGYLIQQVPWIEEVSIGHALFCEALEQSLAVTIRNYMQILEFNPRATSANNHDPNLHSPRA